jgi:hypothetical protein
MTAAVDQHVAKQEADRAEIREALARPQVGEMASRFGMRLDRIAASVGTLSGADLERAASASREVNQGFVGGQSITFSATTIIILLLVLILIIVAVR